MRGGRNIDRRGARASEEGAIQIPVVTIWPNPEQGLPVEAPEKDSTSTYRCTRRA
jgi:hypothetical protein